MAKNDNPTCVDCGTQNCKFKNRTYPEFCLTTHLKDSDMEWALERYEEGRNKEIMIASAEVEYEATANGPACRKLWNSPVKSMPAR